MFVCSSIWKLDRYTVMQCWWHTALTESELTLSLTQVMEVSIQVKGNTLGPTIWTALLITKCIWVWQTNALVDESGTWSCATSCFSAWQNTFFSYQQCIHCWLIQWKGRVPQFHLMLTCSIRALERACNNQCFTAAGYRIMFPAAKRACCSVLLLCAITVNNLSLKS